MSEGVAHPGAERLADFGLGKLGDAEAREVWRHLEGCEACRRRVEGQTPDSFLRALKRGQDPATAPTADLEPSPFPAEGTHPYEAPTPRVPAELSRSTKYRVLEKLGQGGMGAVYRAEQVGLNRVVAIKVMSSTIIDNPEAVRRFRQEVKAAGQLQHPTIVTAFDADQVGGVYFLVMEYVAGRSLDQVVRQDGPLAIADACRLVTQAAVGLQHAHEKGMVHRDIKPHNLMATEKGTLKILDFGLAQLPLESRSRMSGTAVNSFLGTPEFVAPEQANDASSVDIRTDIYSLGCTLYYLLAGRAPFVRDTPLNTIFAHVHEEAVPLPQLRADVPAALWEIVARMMAKRRDDRFATPREVALHLESFLARDDDCAEVEPLAPRWRTARASPDLLPTAARRDSIGGPEKSSRGTRLASATALVLGLLLVSVAVFSTLRSLPEPKPDAPDVVVVKPPGPEEVAKGKEDLPVAPPARVDSLKPSAKPVPPDRPAAQAGTTYSILAAIRDQKSSRQDRERALTALLKLGEVSPLVEFLGYQDEESAFIRNSALTALQDWVRKNPDQRHTLIDKIERRRASSSPALLVTLLGPLANEDKEKPDTYSKLIDHLDHDDFVLRGLASARLYEALADRVPAAALKIPYDRAMSSEERKKAIDEWRKLIPPGTVPPKR